MADVRLEEAMAHPERKILAPKSTPVAPPVQGGRTMQEYEKLSHGIRSQFLSKHGWNWRDKWLKGEI